MKKNFKKLVATILATVSITGISSLKAVTNAVPPAIFTARLPFPYSESTVVRLLDSKIKEFESLAPGVFFVDPSLKDPKKAVPICYTRMVYQIIAQITAVFERFPNLKDIFVEQINATMENKRFELVPLSDKLDHIVSGLCFDGKYVPSNAVYRATDAIRIHINPRQFMYIAADPECHEYYKENIVMFNDDYTPTGITHELGHLFSYIIICSKCPEIFSEFVKANKNLSVTLNKEPELLNNIDLFKSRPESQKMNAVSYIINEIQKQIARQILDIAHEKYGQPTGVAHISPYGDRKPNEFLAEIFADAICSKNPTPLGMAMLEYLYTL